MVNYPYGRTITENDDLENSLPSKHKKVKNPSYANRGMDFEHEVNLANQFYLEQDRAVIYKRATPIHIVKVNYKDHCRITDAYFEQQSTTDYNGLYRGRYIDFECKETKVNTSLSFQNISPHQIKHLERIQNHGGIAFFLIYFSKRDEIFLLPANVIIECYKSKERHSITYETIKEYGCLIEQSFLPRVKYLDAVDKVYFNEEINKNNQ